MKPTNCHDCNTKLRPANRASSPTNGIVCAVGVDDLCIQCYEYAGWENTHSDEGHDSLPADHEYRLCCPVCRNEAPAPRTSHTNTVAKTRTSHNACYEKGWPGCTAKERAQCRRNRTAT